MLVAFFFSAGTPRDLPLFFRQHNRQKIRPTFMSKQNDNYTSSSSSIWSPACLIFCCCCGSVASRHSQCILSHNHSIEKSLARVRFSVIYLKQCGTNNHTVSPVYINLLRFNCCLRPHDTDHYLLHCTSSTQVGLTGLICGLR